MLRNFQVNEHRGCSEKIKVVFKVFDLLLVLRENTVLAQSVTKEILA